jgi:hypothetical protein
MYLKASRVIVAMIGLSLVMPVTLQAQYIDPGTSSLLWQLLLTGLVGVSFTFRRTFADIVRRIRNRRARTGRPERQTEDDSEEDDNHRIDG